MLQCGVHYEQYNMGRGCTNSDVTSREVVYAKNTMTHTSPFPRSAVIKWILLHSALLALQNH